MNEKLQAVKEWAEEQRDEAQKFLSRRRYKIDSAQMAVIEAEIRVYMAVVDKIREAEEWL